MLNINDANEFVFALVWVWKLKLHLQVFFRIYHRKLQNKYSFFLILFNEESLFIYFSSKDVSNHSQNHCYVFWKYFIPQYFVVILLKTYFLLYDSWRLRKMASNGYKWLQMVCFLSISIIFSACNFNIVSNSNLFTRHYEIWASFLPALTLSGEKCLNNWSLCFMHMIQSCEVLLNWFSMHICTI